MRGIVRVLVLVLVSPAWADTFTYTDQTGAMQTVEAALVGEREGTLVLGLADGQYRVIPQVVVKERKPGPDPEPLTADEVAQSLETHFTSETFRSRT